MKTNFIFRSICCIFTATTLFACTQEVIETLPIQAESETQLMKVQSKYRTYGEALAIAQDAIGMLGESSVTRSGNPRTIDIHNVQYIVNTSSTRSDGKTDTLMYVFNYNDNAGFAVVSANRATEGLIAVTEQGNYVAGEETGNGGFDLYMDMAEEYVMRAFEPIPPIGGGGQEILTQFKMFVDRDTTTFGPYLQVRWGQDWPYNMACPIQEGLRTKAGCVATAIAQIMTYYKHPSSFTATFQPTDYVQQLDWDEILEHKYTENTTDETCSQCTSSTIHNVIASLIRQIGVKVEMIYGVKVSGTDSELFARSALTHFGYTSGSYQDYSNYVVANSIIGRKLVFMRGGISADDGHAWVIDGYRHIHELHRECIKPINALEWIEQKRWTEDHYYNHINWGWNGENNGYFLRDVFDITNPQGLDSGMRVSDSIDYNFTYDLKIIPNITKQQ